MIIKHTFSYTGASGAVTIQWFRTGDVLVENGTFSGVVVTGATTTELTITDATSEWFGAYYARVTDAAGCIAQTSPRCTLAVSTPESQDIRVNNTLTLSVVSIGSVGTPTYQWYFNDVALVDGPSGSATIAGSTTAELVITGITLDMSGEYSVTVTDPDTGSCSVTSSADVEVKESAISFAFFFLPLAEPSIETPIITDYAFQVGDQATVSLALKTAGSPNDYLVSLTVDDGTDSNTITDEPVSMTIRTWNLIAVVYNENTGLASVYVNAVLVGTTAGTPVAIGPQPSGRVFLQNSAGDVLDAQSRYVFLQDFTGAWVNHALTGAEITALYNSGTGLNGPPWGSVTPPSVWWNFDDAGRLIGSENFVDSIIGALLAPSNSAPQIEGLSGFSVIKTDLNTELSTGFLTALEYI